jgi:CDP-diacylglycerol--serine O-phosphatidyltransferase
MFPTLMTLGNLVCGFTAVFLAIEAAGSPDVGAAAQVRHGAWLVFLAMVFDALDGKIARMTGAAGRFGGQLDSLADLATFGLAPPLLVKASAGLSLAAGNTPMFPPNVLWALCVLYAVCAALRLARFNVENVPDESAHQDFAGLPSPAAAALVAAALLQYFDVDRHWGPYKAYFFLPAMPFVLLGSALLMVSRVRYPHFVNRLLQGRRSFRILLEVMLLLLVTAFFPERALFLGSVLYVLSGPLLHLRARFRAPAPQPGPQPAPPPGPASGLRP